MKYGEEGHNKSYTECFHYGVPVKKKVKKKYMFENLAIKRKENTSNQKPQANLTANPILTLLLLSGL